MFLGQGVLRSGESLGVVVRAPASAPSCVNGTASILAAFVLTETGTVGII